MEKTMDIFQKRKITYTFVFLSLILIFCGASLVTQFHLAEGIQSFPAALHWIFSNLIPDETAMERLPKILDKLVETALLSVAVTASAPFSSVCWVQALPKSIGASIVWCVL